MGIPLMLFIEHLLLSPGCRLCTGLCLLCCLNEELQVRQAVLHSPAPWGLSESLGRGRDGEGRVTGSLQELKLTEGVGVGQCGDLGGKWARWDRGQALASRQV